MAKIKLVGRSYQFRMRVPKRFSSVEDRREIYASLKTASLLDAEAKAAKFERELIAMWEARAAGESPDYEAILAYCQTMGHAYKPVGEQGREDYVTRMAAMDPRDHTQFRALMGTVSAPGMSVSKMPAAYEKLSKYRLQKKNEEQLRIWRIPFSRAASSFVEVCGDLQMEEVSARETTQYREHMRKQVETGAIVANTANRMFGSLQTMFKEISLDKKLTLQNPFVGLRLKEVKTKGRRKAVPQELIKAILAPGALDRINDEARDVIHICINTGCRPSEVCGVKMHHMHLQANVPHFELEEEGRELKTSASVRKVVLVGVALEAMKRRHAAGGFSRYEGKHSSMTNLINKFLRNNGLLPEPFTMYGFRHSFEDRLISQKLPERLSAELMGHEVRRERYGDGPDLHLLAEALEPISYY
jgi:integrase